MCAASAKIQSQRLAALNRQEQPRLPKRSLSFVRSPINGWRVGRSTRVLPVVALSVRSANLPTQSHPRRKHGGSHT